MLTRRSAIILLGLSPLAALKGCGGGLQAQCDAVTTGSDERCAQCGMVVVDYPGPKGQVCVDDGTTNLSFCSTTDLFAWVMQAENSGRVRQAYVHDLGRTGWETPEDAALMVAEKALYVMGDPRMGAMGPTLIPYSSAQEAERHAQSLGRGRVLTYEEIDWDVLNAITQSMLNSSERPDYRR